VGKKSGSEEMAKNIKDFMRETILAKHWTRKSRVRSLLSLMFSAMLIMSNATPFVQVASAASGDFSIDFTAAAPQSYNHLTGGGAFDDGTIGVDKDVVESLEGGDFSCGDIVTFFAVVKADGTLGTPLSDDPQTIEMNLSFTADTTGQSGAAFGDIVDVRVNYGTIEDLISGENTIDEGNIDDGGSVATLTSETLTGPLFQKDSELQGTVELNDIEAGEQIVVRIDVKIFCDPDSNPTGNLQAALKDARLTFINGNVPASGVISAGQQTIPLKKIDDLHNPELDIQKTVNTTDGTCPGVETLTVTSGDTVKYCYIVSNPGNAPLYNVNVIDDAGTPSNTADDFTVTLSSGLTDVDGDGDADDLTAGGTATGTALVTLFTAGTIVNNATATGNDSIIQPTTLTDSDIATVIVEGVPAYTIEKIVTDVAENGSQASVTKAGDVISYQINVTNTGNIELTNVTVTDPLLGTLTGPNGDNAPTNVLNIGESWIYTGTYTVTQEDLQSNATLEPDNIEPGFIDNKVTATTTELPAPQTDIEQVPVIMNPAYTIDKSVVGIDKNGDGIINSAGDVIEYQITVNNTGNIDLTNVTVTDPLLGALTGPTGDNPVIGVLEVGESWIFTGNYTVTQADINSNGGGDGDIDNTATVDSDQLPPQEDSEDVPIEQNPAYTIEKIVTDVDGRGAEANVTDAGDVISYQITVNNTGNVDLTNVTVMDSLIENLNGPAESLSDDGILEVGETWTYTGTYTVTLEDITTNGGEDGYIDNTATVYCDQLDPKSDSAAVPVKVPVCENPDYTIEKCITDVDCRGPDASVKEAGDVITYSIIVTNTGDIDLTNVTVMDSLIALAGPLESKNKDNVLEVGETWTYTGKYTVTQNDIDTDGGCDGYIDNTATVNCDQLDPKSDSARVPIEKTPSKSCPAYRIEKCVTDVDCRGPDANVTGAGDVITYRITVTNTGNIDLTNVIITDPLIKTLKGPVESKDADGVLDVGEKWTYTGSYTVTQKDMETSGKCDGNINNVAMVNCEVDTNSECEGYIDNTATVDCDQLGPKSDTVRVLIEKASTEDSTDEDSTDEDSIDEDPVEIKQDYCMYKSIIGVDEAGDCIINEAGDIIEYQIIVRNEGSANLTGVSVSDPMITLTGPTGDEIDPGVLNPGETWKFFGNYTVTREDINSNGGGDGFIENKAFVICNELPEESSSVKQPIVLSSDKKDNGSGGDNEKDGDTESDGDTGSARVIPKSSTKDEMNGNREKETGTGIGLEPEIKSFEQETGNTQGDAEKVPEQEESTGIPGFLIFGIIGLLAILLFVLLNKRK
jgi:uncharacterized repeat protein (TIGR01451 family)